MRADDVGAETELLADPRTEPCPGVAAGGFRYAGVVAATAPLLAVVPALPVEPVVPPPPVTNGYQRIELFRDVPELDEEVVEELPARGVGVGPGASPSSSGSEIAVSGFSRNVGSPLVGTSSTSLGPCASFIRLARAGVQVSPPAGLRQVKPYTPWASRVSEFGETGYVPGLVGRPVLTSSVSAATAGAADDLDVPDDEDEQAASDEASRSAAATRTAGSAWRRR